MNEAPTKKPAALDGHVTDERDGWLRLEQSFIIELIKDKRFAGTVPTELRWKWSKVRLTASRLALVDDAGKLWDWKLRNGLWIRPL